MTRLPARIRRTWLALPSWLRAAFITAWSSGTAVLLPGLIGWLNDLQDAIANDAPLHAPNLRFLYAAAVAAGSGLVNGLFRLRRPAEVAYAPPPDPGG